MRSTKMKQETLEPEGYDVVDMNLLEKQEVVDVIENFAPDYIFHLAAQSSVAVSWSNPQLTVDVNIKGALNLLDVLKEMEYKGRVLLIGSGEEYGSGADRRRYGTPPRKYICSDKKLPEYAWYDLCAGISVGTRDGSCIYARRTETVTAVRCV